MKRLAALAVLVALLTSCSSDKVDADAWRADLADAGVTYSTDALWLDYFDAWTWACKANDLQPLIDRVHTETMVLHRTWEQARINVEHACPDRVDELADAIRAEG